MKYKVIKRFKRLSEGLKEYKVNDIVELPNADGLEGYVLPLENKKAKITKKLQKK